MGPRPVIGPPHGVSPRGGSVVSRTIRRPNNYTRSRREREIRGNRTAMKVLKGHSIPTHFLLRHSPPPLSLSLSLCFKHLTDLPELRFDLLLKTMVLLIGDLDRRRQRDRERDCGEEAEGDGSDQTSKEKRARIRERWE